MNGVAGAIARSPSSPTLIIRELDPAGAFSPGNYSLQIGRRYRKRRSTAR